MNHYADDPLAAVLTALDLRITAIVNQLIAADASKHDLLAGQLRGLNHARSLIDEEIKRYREAA